MDRGRIPLLPASARWALVGVVCLGIVVGSVVLAPPDPPDPSPIWDKQLHVAAYASLSLTLAYATATTPSERSLAQVATIVAVASAYGVGIEAAQWMAPARHPSAFDAVANAVGALAAVPWIWLESRLGYVRCWESE